MPKSKESVSLKKEVTLHGVTIRKMPNGAFLEALELIKQLPENFIKSLMEGKTELKLSDMFTIENIANLIGTLLTVAPSFTIKFLAQLMQIDEEIIQKKLTPLETIEIAEKFWEINQMSDFFTKMKPIMTRIMPSLTKLIGFKEQLPSA